MIVIFGGRHSGKSAIRRFMKEHARSVGAAPLDEITTAQKHNNTSREDCCFVSDLTYAKMLANNDFIASFACENGAVHDFYGIHKKDVFEQALFVTNMSSARTLVGTDTDILFIYLSNGEDTSKNNDFGDSLLNKLMKRAREDGTCYYIDKENVDEAGESMLVKIKEYLDGSFIPVAYRLETS